ncbi:MAG: hypothetical protein K8U57_16065 [Planctomycetes bacterium]|nr:hypothetical protein [Planctomycetota bacterium]
MTSLTPLYASMEGFGDALAICMLAPVGLGLLLLFVWWAILGMIYKERREARVLRFPRIPPLPVVPSGGRTLPEWIEIIHLHAAAHLDMDVIAAGGPVTEHELRRVIRHIVETEVPVAVGASEREKLIETVVNRLLDVSEEPPRSEPETTPDGKAK